MSTLLRTLFALSLWLLLMLPGSAADDYLEQARDAQKAGRYKEAVELLTDACHVADAIALDQRRRAVGTRRAYARPPWSCDILRSTRRGMRPTAPSLPSKLNSDTLPSVAA